MQNVIEEKITRIVEVIVSSIKPYHFLFGKLIGVCCCLFDIFAIWGDIWSDADKQFQFIT